MLCAAYSVQDTVCQELFTLFTLFLPKGKAAATEQSSAGHRRAKGVELRAVWDQTGAPGAESEAVETEASVGERYVSEIVVLTETAMLDRKILEHKWL